MEISKGKPGRPKKSESTIKSETIAFTVTKVQAKEIADRARAIHLTVSEYCSKAILESGIIAPFTEEELSLKRGLVGMANNLNQIAYRANAAGIESVEQSAKELLREIKKELKKFKE
ncbi:plasmid mobilization protein [Dyadobacter bucti]|uniref:plasmid mobilization protein n=1 Tax=Dyadobacter bucti TaxID=2572203 RepID=UPI0011086C60|nr:plasmid mobilization relaxosome protein MobC [Dyadobacter bucti]